MVFKEKVGGRRREGVEGGGVRVRQTCENFKSFLATCQDSDKSNALCVNERN